MIKLYTLPAAFGLRNPSPFCLKVEMALAHLDVPFEYATTLELNKAPKGKVPWIDDDGIIADSELILAHLDKKTDGGLFDQLTAEEVAVGTAFSRLADDHFYWMIVASRWLDDGWFNNVKRAFFDPLPWPISKIIPIVARRSVRKTYDLHGLGRHTMEEQQSFLKRDIAAIEAWLSEHQFIASNRITVYDFTVASMLAGAMDNQPATWLSKITNESQPLRDYVERVQEKTGIYCREK